MALHIRKDILDKYSEFYSFVLEQDDNVLILKGLDNAAAAALDEYDAENIAIKDSPKLTDFSFLHKFTNAKSIGVFRCKKLVSVWDITRNPHMKALVIKDCKKLRDIDSISYGGKLENIFIGGKAYMAPCLSALYPLAAQKSLKTLDLAIGKCADTRKIAFDIAWPCLESLTISPNMRKYFLSENEV